MAKASKVKTREIALERIDPPKGRVRLEIDPDRIAELAQSIRERGLLQPIVVRQDGDRFEIVFGHRRYLAVRQLGLKTITATVREMNDADVALDRATENIQRDDLSPVEEGAIYKDLMETHGLTVEEVGRRMGKSPGVVIRRIHLLRMPEVLQKAVHSRGVSVSAAEELARIKDLGRLSFYTEMACEHGATQAVCRSWAQEWAASQRMKEAGAGGGGLPGAAFEDKPVYVTCDTCHGAMELGKEVVLRCCPECGEQILKAVRK
ncbi:MAG: ParB/RepB/Spo0J family partition protein [Deltaproteobacteria bacterium]|nr:ParB/RepB/Spo0J family partition protein [Deltaproteobacteria bacterium]